jgi:T4 RnlA family RNA ligase
MYTIVKNYKVKFVNAKEDGSVASFIQLPNGKIYGKSKMSFESEQAVGITSIFKKDNDINQFVTWCMNNDIVPIFEYVAPQNRVVLKYSTEELVLLRLRNNTNGKHIDLKDHLDKIGSIKIAPFKDDFIDLDSLIELTGKEVDKEGYVVQAEDEMGRDFFFKLKTPWYCERHGLLTEDLYKENIIIGYILSDKIDDILGQIPEDEKEARERIHTLVSMVRKEISEKSVKVDELYNTFLKMGRNKKEFALKFLRNNNFPFVMELAKRDELMSLSKEEILDRYKSMDHYESLINRLDKHELIKDWIRDNTKRLLLARNWVKERNPTMFFRNPIENEEDN